MNATISFQDCERKAPPVSYPLMSLDAKPSGIDFKFSKGVDSRSHRPNVYTVSLTPAIGTGKWESVDDDGDLERVQQTKQPQGNRVQGIWVEAGDRREFVLEFV